MSRILGLLKANTTSFPGDLIAAITSSGGAPVQIWSGDSAFFAVIAEGDASVQTAMGNHAAVACATSTPIQASYLVDPGAEELAGAWNTYLSSDYQTSVDTFYSQQIGLGSILPPGGCSQGAQEDSGGGNSGPLVASNGPTGGGASSDPGATSSSASDPSASASDPNANGGAAQLGSGGGVATLVNPRGGAAALATAVVHKERRALVGTIGVAVAYVGGPAGTSAELTATDNANLALSLMHAFDALYNLAPAAAHLVFEVNVRRTTLTIDPSKVPVPANPAAPAAADYEAAECVWRDPALTLLGQSAGWAGIDSFISSATFSDTPDYTHAALLTKYPAAWMAYCSSSRKIVFQLAAVASSNWGLASAHLVYAHETGHTSGAPDEYASSNCKTTDSAGFSNGANANCEVGNAAAVDCLMRNVTKKICPATTGHFGWNDANGDGILDPFDSTYST
jgi:hypothetical protein